jgi:peptidoglycan-associated lipoprotein
MVHFEYDESDITSEAERVLRDKVDILRANPAVRMRVEGHADERGSTEYNQALASRRAQSVKTFITGFGLEGDRFETVSFGEERPLVNRSDEEAWAQNRRAEFVITGGGATLNAPR